MLVATDARCHVRCRCCRARRVLPRHPERYVRALPRCSSCGARAWAADKWMNNRPTGKLGCICGGYWFKHRKGSLYCWHRVDGSDRLPGDYDFRDRTGE